MAHLMFPKEASIPKDTKDAAQVNRNLGAGACECTESDVNKKGPKLPLRHFINNIVRRVTGKRAIVDVSLPTAQEFNRRSRSPPRLTLGLGVSETSSNLDDSALSVILPSQAVTPSPPQHRDYGTSLNNATTRHLLQYPLLRRIHETSLPEAEPKDSETAAKMRKLEEENKTLKVERTHFAEAMAHDRELISSLSLKVDELRDCLEDRRLPDLSEASSVISRKDKMLVELEAQRQTEAEAYEDIIEKLRRKATKQATRINDLSRTVTKQKSREKSLRERVIRWRDYGLKVANLLKSRRNLAECLGMVADCWDVLILDNTRLSIELEDVREEYSNAISTSDSLEIEVLELRTAVAHHVNEVQGLESQNTTLDIEVDRLNMVIDNRTTELDSLKVSQASQMAEIASKIMNLQDVIAYKEKLGKRKRSRILQERREEEIEELRKSLSSTEEELTKARRARCMLLADNARDLQFYGLQARHVQSRVDRCIQIEEENLALKRQAEEIQEEYQTRLGRMRSALSDQASSRHEIRKFSQELYIKNWQLRQGLEAYCDEPFEDAPAREQTEAHAARLLNVRISEDGSVEEVPPAMSGSPSASIRAVPARRLRRRGALAKIQIDDIAREFPRGLADL
ncbi:hypothetical protein MMC25_000508 [Agyrium rufum]|nr:hypothetical protein [Agyrium rufum]